MAITILYQTSVKFSLSQPSIRLTYACGGSGLLRGLLSTVNPIRLIVWGIAVNTQQQVAAAFDDAINFYQQGIAVAVGFFHQRRYSSPLLCRSKQVFTLGHVVSQL